METLALKEPRRGIRLPEKSRAKNEAATRKGNVAKKAVGKLVEMVESEVAQKATTNRERTRTTMEKLKGKKIGITKMAEITGSHRATQTKNLKIIRRKQIKITELQGVVEVRGIIAMKQDLPIGNPLVRTMPARTQKTKTIVAGKIRVVVVQIETGTKIPRRNKTIVKMLAKVMAAKRLKTRE